MTNSRHMPPGRPARQLLGLTSVEDSTTILGTKSRVLNDDGPVSSDRAAGLAAAAAAVGFAGVAIFQIALAAGVPWGEAAWGGQPARLPTGLRVGSGIVSVVYAAAAPLIVLGRAGYFGRDSSSWVFRSGTWFLAALMALGTLLNFASASRWENYLWGPYSLTLAILCVVVARRAQRGDG